MADGRFKKGQIPWNKGTKGVMKVNATSFIKGQPAHNKKTPLKKVCPSCGTKFEVRPSWSYVVCCSRKCFSKGRPSPMKGKKHSEETREKLSKSHIGLCSGENHYNWKGGSTRLERVKFRDRMQTQIFERDDYTCQVCQQRGGSLQVDHIKSWAEYPKLRFIKSNCRTLCMACHYYITFKRTIPKGLVWGHNMSQKEGIL